MADIDIPQTREAVDVFAAIGVPQHRPAALDHDQRLVVVIGVV